MRGPIMPTTANNDRLEAIAINAAHLLRLTRDRSRFLENPHCVHTDRSRAELAARRTLREAIHNLNRSIKS